MVLLPATDPPLKRPLVESDPPDVADRLSVVSPKSCEFPVDPKFIYEYELLTKIVENFGNLTDSLDGKEKNSVIAYHTEKSRYRVLRDQYIEIEDPTNLEKSNLFKLNDGNTISSKNLLVKIL